MDDQKESSLKIKLLVLLLLGFDANLGVELVWNMSVFSDNESLGEKWNRLLETECRHRYAG